MNEFFLKNEKYIKSIYVHLGEHPDYKLILEIFKRIMDIDKSLIENLNLDDFKNDIINELKKESPNKIKVKEYLDNFFDRLK